jgi:hypothetical protein
MSLWMFTHSTCLVQQPKIQCFTVCAGGESFSVSSLLANLGDLESFISYLRLLLSIQDEAHFIKTRSSQTANAAFSLVGIHRWCLSGTPLQNRVGEFYSLVRFLRLDPMAFYYCRTKGCDCKNMHYRIHAGVCEDCGHGGVQHFSHFNKYVLNPIQREGYT